MRPVTVPGKDRHSTAWERDMCSSASCRWLMRWFWFDLFLIFAIALISEAAAFGRANGKTVINADSIQYIYNAEAILGGDTPDYSLRKPGYSLWLAAVGYLFGNMTWGAIVANYGVLTLLPVAAYGIGYEFRGRWAGWLAALLCVIQTHEFHYADRILTESLYVVLLTFGIWALIAAVKQPTAVGRWMLTGSILAAAWSVRSAAVLAIGVAVMALIGIHLLALRSQHRTTAPAGRIHLASQPKSLAFAIVALLLPVFAAYTAEAASNYRSHGYFRKSTGSIGMMLLMRTRHLQGLPMPDTEEAAQCLAWLPERSSDDAFRANEVDTWMARYRARRSDQRSASGGKKVRTDWDVDTTMRQTAGQIARRAPLTFLGCSLDIGIGHLLRSNRVPYGSYVDHADRYPVLSLAYSQGLQPTHPDPVDLEMGCDWEHWWAFASMPQMSPDRQADLAVRIEQLSRERAPFAGQGPLAVLRYAAMHPLSAGLIDTVNATRFIPPLLVLLLVCMISQRWQLGFVLALLYLTDALLISICCPSESAAMRYRSIWLGLDAAIIGIFLSIMGSSLVVLWRARNIPKLTRNSSIPI
ncbi:MAG: hypothetical protein ACPGXK_06565 [Phycisphaerae bacterium]